MPRFVLVMLFALIVASNWFFVLRVLDPSFTIAETKRRPAYVPSREEKRSMLTYSLGAIDLSAVVLTYALVRTRRWRADWDALKAQMPQLVTRLSAPDLLRDPVGFERHVPHEPPNVYLEVPFESILRWDVRLPGHQWLDRPEAAEMLALITLRLFLEQGLTGAYVGRAYHDTGRVVAAGKGPVRALHSRGRGSVPAYTMRVDSGCMHLTATFRIKQEGKTLVLGWYQTAQRVTAWEALWHDRWWALLSLVGAVLFPLMVPLILLYAVATHPPGRGWTSLWAKHTRDRIDQPRGESQDEQLARISFESNVRAVFQGLANIQAVSH